MTISPNARTVFRNYVMDGVPSSGIHKINKGDERNWGTALENAIDAYSSGAGSIAKATRALLYADLAHAADVMAWVYADSTVGYNGIYRKSLGTGTGSWTRILDLPYDVITATDTGAGTPNAIVATSSIPVSESALILLNMFEANTASPVTVAFNGGSALTIKTASGNDVASGGLVAGAAVLGRISGSTFRMISDQTSAAIQAAAEAAQAAAEAAAASVSLPTTLTPLTIPVTNAAGTLREDLPASDVREFLDLAFVDNYSMPSALNRQPVYVALDGTDDTGGNMYHGFEPEYPFRTKDAALLHAQKHLRFTGRLKGIDMRFGPGRHGGFNLGSNHLQGQEKFPFSIGISSIDPTDWAIFDGITCGTWGNNDIYIEKVDAAYFTATRFTSMSVNNVGYRPMRDIDNNPVYVSYGMYSGLGSYLHGFGNHEIKEPIVNASAFLYASSRGNLLLENGDSPTIFPEFNLVGAAGITSPYKYRAVLGSYMYVPVNPWADLTYATNFYCDATSLSSQTQSGSNVNLNAASGGPCVADSGNTQAGWRLYADGYCEQWGFETLIDLATGRTNAAATITFSKELISVSYLVVGGTNNADVHVSLHGTPLTTGFPLGAYNHNPAATNATARWRVCGYIA